VHGWVNFHALCSMTAQVMSLTSLNPSRTMWYTSPQKVACLVSFSNLVSLNIFIALTKFVLRALVLVGLGVGWILIGY